ncbi:apolipoprotein D-like [Ochlerotatus camptorhynchus]|uniref:apolipoprotein D-like n=1 Tax=Ochlerotatus camptorhynchus TaxID=644619 RepID=UPI0031D9AD2C
MKSALVATAVAFVLCLSVETSFAQIINIGQCPEDVEVVQNFDVEAYLGQWYEISRYEQTFQRNGECTQAHYSVNDDGSVRVQNRQLVPPSSLFEQEIGRAVISFPDEDPLQAKLNVSFGGMPPISSNYWVLDTDYTGFAFVFSCFPVSDNIKGENYWLLSRTTELPANAQDRVEELTEKFLIRRHIRVTKHDLYFCVNEGSTESTETTETTEAPETTDAMEPGESPNSHAKVEDKRSKRVYP